MLIYLKNTINNFVYFNTVIPIPVSHIVPLSYLHVCVCVCMCM